MDLDPASPRLERASRRAGHVLAPATGYRLLYAGGADRAPQAWLERWDIYAVFIAAFAVVLGWRLGGLPLAGVVALLAVLGVHEPDSPRYSLIALLLLVLGWQALTPGDCAGRWLSAA